jgi:hypothetical protein
MFDLSNEYIRLLEMSRLGYDYETGEVLEEEEVDRAFAALTGDVQTKVAGAAFVVMRLDKEADMVDEEIRRLQLKKIRIQRGHDRLKDRIRQLMSLTEIDRVKTPSISVTLGKPAERVAIYDKELLPEEYRVSPPWKPHKLAIKKAIQNGDEIAGAHLEKGQASLTIR